jgi:hypothetical protein
MRAPLPAWVNRYQGSDASASADIRWAANSDEEIKEQRLVVKRHNRTHAPQ